MVLTLIYLNKSSNKAFSRNIVPLRCIQSRWNATLLEGSIMAYKIEYKDDEKLIITTFSGVVTDDDFLNSIDEKANSKDRVKLC